MPILQIAATLLSCGLFALFITYDGLNNAESFKSLILSIIHIIAALPMSLTLINTIQTRHYLHAGLTFLGLGVYSAMA